MPNIPSVDGEPNQPAAPYQQLVGPMPPPPDAELAAARQIGSPGRLATATAILLGIAAVASALNAFAHYNRVTAVRAFLVDKTKLADLDQADDLVIGATRLMAGVVLVTGIVFIIWHYKFARKAEHLHGPLGLSSGWAIGGWLIPVGNLVLPFIQLNHAAKASDPALPPGTAWTSGRVPGLLKAWTATYIAAPVVYVVSSTNASRDRVTSMESRAMQFIHADLGAWFSMLIYTAAAVLGLFMVWVLSQRQNQAATTVYESDQGAAPTSTA